MGRGTWDLSGFPAVVKKKNDILLGKTKECFNHEGNSYFRDMINENVSNFKAVEDGSIVQRKKFFENFVVKYLRNARFLKFDETKKVWRALPKDHKIVKEKVSHALRDSMKYHASAPPKKKKPIKKVKSQFRNAKEALKKKGERAAASEPALKELPKVNKKEAAKKGERETTTKRVPARAVSVRSSRRLKEQLEGDPVEPVAVDSSPKGSTGDVSSHPGKLSSSLTHSVVASDRSEGSEEQDLDNGDDEDAATRRTRKTNAFGPSTTRSSRRNSGGVLPEPAVSASKPSKKESIKKSAAKQTAKSDTSKKVAAKKAKTGSAKKPKQGSKSKIRKPVLPLLRKGAKDSDAVDSGDGDDSKPRVAGSKAPAKSYGGPRGLVSKRQKVKPEAIFVVNKTKPSDRPQEYVDDPGPRDVLLGGGTVDHNGNEEFLERVAEEAASYMAIDRKQLKAQFIENFISTSIEQGFRFLRFDIELGRWYVVTSPIRDRHVRSRVRAELSGTELDPAAEHLTEGVDIRPDDILLGKSATCYNHPGNMTFRDKIATCSPEFTKIDVKKDKVKYIDDLIKFFVDRGSRFLRLDPEIQGWCVVPDSSKVVREKCTHALREPMYDRFKNSTRTSTKLGAVTKAKNLKRKKAVADHEAEVPSKTVSSKGAATRAAGDSKKINPSELSAAQILVCLESMVSDNSESNGDDEKPQAVSPVPDGFVEKMSLPALDESQVKDLECNEDLPCESDEESG